MLTYYDLCGPVWVFRKVFYCQSVLPTDFYAPFTSILPLGPIYATDCNGPSQSEFVSNDLGVNFFIAHVLYFPCCQGPVWR